MIDITDSPGGAILPVRARPGAKSDGLLGEHGGALRVAVTAPAEAGKANEAIIRLLASALKLRRAQIELIGGAGSRTKRFRIVEIRADELRARIGRVLEPTLFDPPDASV